MQRYPLTLAGALILSCGSSFGAEEAEPAAAGVGILPDHKQGLVVEPKERNPYGIVVVEKKEALSRGEAGKLTDILRGLPFSGLSRSDRGEVRAVLLGDLRLVEGETVPQLVEGQTDELFVESVSEDEVVIIWAKEAGRQVTESRKLNLPLDGAQKVKMVLPGQGRASGAPRSVLVTPQLRRPGLSNILPTAGVPLPSENP